MNNYLTFKGDEKILEEIASDPTLKPLICTKITWNEYMMLGLSDDLDDQTRSYLVLKYGDYMKDNLVRDFSPIPGKDYTPTRTSMDASAPANQSDAS